MIITNDFIYFHKGKTGGDKFYNLMNSQKNFKDSIIYQNYTPDNNGRNTNQRKHGNIWQLQRQYCDINTIQCVLGFRKLSSWLLSFANHHLYNRFKKPSDIKHINTQLNQGLIIKHDTILPTDIDIYNDWNWIYADNVWQLLLRFNKKPEFIRQEYLLKDFNVKIAKPYYNIVLSERHNNLINNFNQSNSPFRINDMETIYKNNPFWTKLEKELYND